ncbi:MAG: hypothetical protein HY533_04800 [Chloroflexi bacterium]|nr:hypothetical protein [Chloroflexota bacterium]
MIYRSEQRVLEMEGGDEVFLRRHFENARRAWKAQREITDATYHYKPDEQGVWGFSLGVPKSDYFWPKELVRQQA